MRGLCLRLSNRPFALKGGLCLRFFHRSPRLSEDIDFDVGKKLQTNTLEKAVDGILRGEALQSSLVADGVFRLSFSKPKQTDTTQRWKVTLSLSENTQLPTKIEFSHRSLAEVARAIPHADLLQSYKLPLFAVPHYDASEMIIQKIEALAAPSRMAVRDLFDLHHLIFQQKANLQKCKASSFQVTLNHAAEKILGFSFKDFTEQVRPYLPPDFMALYQTPASFEKLKSETWHHLCDLEKE